MPFCLNSRKFTWTWLKNSGPTNYYPGVHHCMFTHRSLNPGFSLCLQRRTSALTRDAVKGFWWENGLPNKSNKYIYIYMIQKKKKLWFLIICFPLPYRDGRHLCPIFRSQTLPTEHQASKCKRHRNQTTAVLPGRQVGPGLSQDGDGSIYESSAVDGWKPIDNEELDKPW